MDWDYLAKLNKLAAVFTMSFAGGGVLRYDFTGRARELAGTIDTGQLLLAGANAALVDRLAKDVSEFEAAAGWWEANRDSVPSSAVAAVNKTLLEVEVSLNSSFTALDVRDLTVYPHQQVLHDVENLNAAIAALQPPTPDKGAALAALENVGLTVNGLSFSHDVYKASLAVHSSSWSGGLYWGSLGHLSPYLDVMPAYDVVTTGDYAGARASLTLMRNNELTELDGRLANIADILEKVTRQICALP